MTTKHENGLETGDVRETLEIERLMAGRYDAVDENGYVVARIIRVDGANVRDRWQARSGSEIYLQRRTLKELVRAINNRWNEVS